MSGDKLEVHLRGFFRLFGRNLKAKPRTLSKLEPPILSADQHVRWRKESDKRLHYPRDRSRSQTPVAWLQEVDKSTSVIGLLQGSRSTGTLPYEISTGSIDNPVDTGSLPGRRMKSGADSDGLSVQFATTEVQLVEKVQVHPQKGQIIDLAKRTWFVGINGVLNLSRYNLFGEPPLRAGKTRLRWRCVGLVSFLTPKHFYLTVLVYNLVMREEPMG